MAFAGNSASSEALTGLTFPSNGVADNDIRFILSGSNLLSAYPATYLWKIKHVQQNGYFTTFFWGPNGAFGGYGYYGLHPYPDAPPNGSSHKYEISADGDDYVTGSPAITTGAWVNQAAVVSESGGHLTIRFYYNVDTLSYIEETFLGYASSFPATNSTYPSGPSDGLSPVLVFGGAPWNTGNECLSGDLRGIQAYNSILSEANISAASAKDYDSEVLALSLSPWYLNMNPTPDDITDKSGNGRNPTWSTANRPTLWTA